MSITEYPIQTQPFLVGTVMEWPGPVNRIPNVWLPSYGQSVLRTTYSALFHALVEMKAAVTFTSASPAVFTNVAHGLVVGDPVFFTGGVGTSGITANTTYYVMTVPSADTFTIGTTRTINVITGAAPVTTAINTSNTGSGTVYLWYAPYEVADSTHFYLPDYRGKTAIAPDNMGGSDAGLIAWANVLGLRAGEGTHTLLSAESGLVAHTHTGTTAATVVNNTGSGGNLGAAGAYNQSATALTINANAAADAASAHNTIQPSISVNKIIYTGVSA